MHSPGHPVLTLDAVSRSFGAVTAVDRLSARFGRGEYFCILGPSGCGKTTLLRLVAGFDAPDSGTIRLHGADVAAVPPEKRDVNVVFQSYALFPHLDVTDNIGFGLRMRGTPRAEARERVDAVIRLVHLEAEARRMPRQLSGGQQQRVALARALVNRPAVLLLDEPLSALDQSLRQRMQAELRRIQRETGVTFLHITHDQHEALSLADRVAVMRRGSFLQVAPPADIYHRPDSAFVASFVGATNLVPVRVLDSATVRLRDDSVLTVPAHDVDAGEALLAVRPEHVRLGEHGIRGRVIALSFTGAALECAVDIGGDVVIRASLPSNVAPPSEGSAVGVAFDNAAVRVLALDDND